MVCQHQLSIGEAGLGFHGQLSRPRFNLLFASHTIQACTDKRAECIGTRADLDKNGVIKDRFSSGAGEEKLVKAVQSRRMNP